MNGKHKILQQKAAQMKKNYISFLNIYNYPQMIRFY